MKRILIKRTFAALLPALIVACGVLPAGAQILSPAQQSIMNARTMTPPATSATNQEKQPVLTTPQNEPDPETIGAVDHALSSQAAGNSANPAPPLLAQDTAKQKPVSAPTAPTRQSMTAAAAAHPAPVAAAPRPAPVVKTAAAPPPQAIRLPYDARRTLFVEVGQKRLRLEAPEKMCFLDRTSAMQQGIYLLLSAGVERNSDQVLLGVFMACDSIVSPDSWLDGMPNSGFVTWMNPSVGENTAMNRQDYLDMREASFPQYTNSRALGSAPDKTVHRNAYNVSLGVTSEETGQDGLRHKSTNVLSTTLLQRVPIEITLHYTGAINEGKGPLSLPEAYAAMDKLVAQQIALNE